MPNRRTIQGYLGSIRARVIVFIAAYALLTAAVLAGFLLHLRTEAIVSGQKVLGSFAELAAEQTTSTLKDIVRTLGTAEELLLNATVTGTVDVEQLRPQFEELLRGLPHLTSIQVVDRQGRIVLGRTAVDGGRDVSDRDYFIRQRAHPESALLWGEPIKARSNGEWLVTATLPILQVNGDFDGLIVGTVPMAYFDEIWKMEGQTESLIISLWRDDGVLMMRSPFDTRALGAATIGKELSLLVRESTGKKRLLAERAIDGVERLVALRYLDTYPDFVLAATQPVDQALTAWWRVAWIVIAGWAAAAMAVGGLSIWVAREWIARRAMEERYRVLFDTNPAALLVFSRDTKRFLEVNDVAVSQYGWSRDELLAMTIDDLYLPEDLTTIRALRQQIAPGIGRFFAGLRHHRKDGSIINIETNVRMIDFGGKPAFLSLARDVTTRLAAEKQAVQMEDRYRGLLEAAPDAMVVVDQTGEIVLVNAQAETQFGYRRDELLGQRVTNIIPEGFAERLVTDAARSISDALAQEIGTGIELSGRRKDGTDFPIEIMLSPLDS
ncbi:MAG: PAS domain S-box protein, partial [Reyranella sp.]|nr:PAS domain S-box protein [Reyranella sp.]